MISRVRAADIFADVVNFEQRALLPVVTVH
jgi:hypothetical protein